MISACGYTLILQSELAEVRIYKIIWIQISKDTKHACPSRFSWFRGCGKNESRKVLGDPREAWGHAIFRFLFSQKTRIFAVAVPQLSRKCTKMHYIANNLPGILAPQPLSQVPLAPPNPQPRHLRPVLSVADEGTRLLHQTSDQRPSHPICQWLNTDCEGCVQPSAACTSRTLPSPKSPSIHLPRWKGERREPKKFRSRPIHHLAFFILTL